MNVLAALMTLVLKLPHRPRSALTTNNSDLPPARGVLRSSSSGCADGSTRAARLLNTRAISMANGRACWMRSCARRSRDAATIFMALVICCVDLTARTRRRMSMREGTRLRHLGRRGERLAEFLEGRVQLALQRIVERLFLGELRHHRRAAGVEVAIQLDLVDAELLDRDRVEIPVGRGVDDRDLLLDAERLILRLLQHFDEAAAAMERVQRRLVEIRSELRERRELTVLREVETQRPGDLAHRFHLRRPADAADRVADVDRRTDALVEQVGLEEDLPVGDRDDVGRDVGREVAGLRLDDRQRGERAADVLLFTLCGAFQQARVQVEDVARVRFATRRTAEQQRDFAVGLRVLRQVVIDAQRVAAAVAEVLAHGAGRVRTDVEQRRRVRRAGGNDDGVFHRAGVLERAHDLRDRRLLLPDRVVDADDVLPLLVDDRVDRDGGLPRLAVADDQLALASADRHHRVDRLQPGLHRLLDRRAVDDAGGDSLDGHLLLRRDRALAVDRLAERVHDAADQLAAHRHRDDAPRALDRIPFLDLGKVPEQHRADAVFFQVQRDAEDVVRELEHLARHRLFDAVHTRNAVTDRDDRADFGHVDVNGITANLVADDLGNFFGFYVHKLYWPDCTSAWRIFSSCVVTLPS